MVTSAWEAGLKPGKLATKTCFPQSWLPHRHGVYGEHFIIRNILKLDLNNSKGCIIQKVELEKGEVRGDESRGEGGGKGERRGWRRCWVNSPEVNSHRSGSTERRDSICSPLFVDRGLASGYQAPVCKSKTVITACCHRPREAVTRPKLDRFFFWADSSWSTLQFAPKRHCSWWRAFTRAVKQCLCLGTRSPNQRFEPQRVHLSLPFSDKLSPIMYCGPGIMLSIGDAEMNEPRSLLSSPHDKAR